MPRMTSNDDLLRRAAKVAFACVDERTDISRFSHPRQVFITIYSVQPVIDNGGFGRFFESDWPGQPPYSRFSDAYRAIGATGVAEWIDQAASMFGVADPHLHREARLRYLNKHCCNDRSELIELGDRAIDESRRVFRLLGKYVRQHASEFSQST